MERNEYTSVDLTEPSPLIELTNSSVIENGAHILYMFNAHSSYVQNATSYIMEGLNKGHRIVLFEDQTFFDQINNNLLLEGYSENTLKQITYICHSKHYSTNNQFQADHSYENLVKLLKPAVKQHRTTRIWGQVLAQNALVSELRKYECSCDEFLNSEKVISVCAYNALETPSYIQNEMLKVHGYFMVDERIEKSPFYNKKYVVNISPTEQLKLQKIEMENQELKRRNQQLVKEQASQKEREQDLRIAKRNAEKANAMKTTFLSQMSHDLRTPLNIIQGYSQISLLETNDPRFQLNIQKIYDASNNLLKLIEEILDFSAIEAGKVSINKEFIHARSFIDQCIKSIFDITHSNQIIKVDDIDDHMYIEADRLRLTQVLTNLITNAVKYTQTNGHISISLDHDSVKDQVIINVEDTGIGIPSNELTLIFEPFYRSKKTMSKWKGTGIGLAIVAQLTTKMDGTYGVISKEGIGSTFWVSFKGFVAKKETTDVYESSIATSSLPVTPKMKILYIEDNLDNVDLMSSMLHIITEVELYSEVTGKSGYHKAIEVQPELILLDLHLPDMNGLEVLDNLKCHPLTKSIPVIVISAEALESTIDLSLEKGCQSYLTKPVHLEKLRDLVLRNSS
ncbi:ATP-binding protein [Halalkalibacter flavus]|uniref:ATP-binding protein n=1 Tax=Halalkalibacter flavus TaxID=3090668 RepID=UPI002FCC05B2